MTESMKQADGSILSGEIKFKWNLKGNYESYRWKTKKQSFQ